MVLRLIDTVTNPTDFIFNALDELDVPWKEDDIASQLDLYYIANTSGEKQISNLVKLLIDTVTHKLSTESITILADTLFVLYHQKWEKLYNLYSLQYDPISNYDMEEKMSNDITTHAINEGSTRVLDSDDSIIHGKTDTVTNNMTDATQHGKTDTVTNNLTNTLQHGKTDTVTNNLTDTENGSKGIVKNVSAFNSSNTYEPAEEINETITNHTNVKTGTQATATTGSDVETNTGTQAIATTGTDTVTHTGTQATATTGTDTNNRDETETIGRNGLNTDTRNYTLTRKGNIGVTTSQQMIESERRLWQWEFFTEIVFPDIDHALTIPYYGGV